MSLQCTRSPVDPGSGCKSGNRLSTLVTPASADMRFRLEQWSETRHAVVEQPCSFPGRDSGVVGPRRLEEVSEGTPTPVV